jgi:hypothetical protein
MSVRLAVVVLVATSLSRRPAAAGGTEVQIVARDGASIGATFFAGAPGPAVVIFRNCDAERASVTDLATALQARGLSTLAHDYRPGLAPGQDCHRMADRPTRRHEVTRGLIADRASTIDALACARGDRRPVVGR